MSLDPKADAALALHRFGMGPRAGSIAAIAGDPRGALLAELDRPDAGRITDADLPTSAEASRAVFEDGAARRAKQIVAERARKEAERQREAAGAVADVTMATMQADPPDGAPPMAEPPPTVGQQIFRRE